MKKSFLVLAAALSLGLAACGNQQPAGPSVPVEDGKVTFYFEMGEEGVEIPSYCNVFLTGAFAGWKTAVGEAVTMQPLEEGSNIWYGQWEGDATTLEDKGYQLTVGYSADSGSMSTGVNWSYKSIECQEASGESGVEIRLRQKRPGGVPPLQSRRKEKRSRSSFIPFCGRLENHGQRAGPEFRNRRSGRKIRVCSSANPRGENHRFSPRNISSCRRKIYV